MLKPRLQMIQKLRRLLRCENGGALAELAILVPFLVIMLAAVAEFGRYFQQYTTLAKSTRTAARYLSNHPLTAQELLKAQNLATCGKLTCAGNDELVKRFSTGGNHICIESTGSPKVTSVTVRIPRGAGNCTPTPNSVDAFPFVYTPVFDISGLLGNSFTFALPIAPSVTMYYLID